MQLYGSTTSPYVRRLRIWCNEYNVEHEFINLDIFADHDRETLKRLNPTRKIPMLCDDEQIIFDSNVIYRYLVAKVDLIPLTWQQENLLTLCNSANDALVELLICQRSGFDTNDDRLFFNLQRERVPAVLAELNKAVENGRFNLFGYTEISLYCLLDWIKFRELADLSAFDALNAFHQLHASRDACVATDPRQ